jgi:type IV pilus assembly protein PilM
MFGIGGSNKAIVGLDIGSSSIKAVELKKTRNGVTVSHLGLEPLASDIVVDSMIVDSGSVASAITKIFTDNGIKSRAVATSVSGHSVIVKKIVMQRMTDQEVAEHIQTEAAQHIPFDIADVNLDYQILTEDPSTPQMDVLLVAVKKDKILNYTNALQLAGRQPAIVDIDAFALQNCYEYNYEPGPSSTVALLNLGASVMNINIVKGNTPLFTRDVSVGGHQYTDSLQNAEGTRPQL